MARTKSATSLRAKLMTLGVQDEIYLPDTQAPGKATIMERAVHTIVRRDPELAQRRFSTERWLAMRPYPVSAGCLLRVRRVDNSADASD